MGINISMTSNCAGMSRKARTCGAWSGDQQRNQLSGNPRICGRRPCVSFTNFGVL